MKLNYKRTFFVGLAFFLICAFWQAYDTLVALALTNKYGMTQFWSGVIMALDNVLALFMLPLFGSLSDRADGRLARRYGKRTPFIVIGTIAGIICFLFMGIADVNQAKQIKMYENPDTVAIVMWDENQEIDNPFYEYQYTEIKAKLGETNAAKYFNTSVEKGKLQTLYINNEVDFEDLLYTAPEQTDEQTDDEYKAVVKEYKQIYSDIVLPIRNQYTANSTEANPGNLIFFIVALFFALVAMATYRSPAVALMPAVTIKPLRSKANAIINIMGVIGGALILGVGMVLGTGSAANAMMGYLPVILITCAVMAVALVVFILTVKEPKLCQLMAEDTVKEGIDDNAGHITDNTGHSKLDKPQLRSLIFLMASIALWFMGYNAITTKYSVYAQTVLDVDYGSTLIIAQIAALIAFLPAGMLASKIGRKKTIMGGIILLTIAFGTASLLGAGTSVWIMNALFVLAGVAWASINVNSLPMVVELATGSDVGKYTGFYYTASMAAQTVTPLISGALMDEFNMRVLFPYGALFVALSFVTMIFVKHGDSKPEAKKGLEALNEAEDLIENGDLPKAEENVNVTAENATQGKGE